MGSSRRPKPRGQPRSANLPPRAAGGGSTTPGRLPGELRIALVRVDAAVAASVDPGNRVTTRAIDGGYAIYAGGKRLGDIPARYRAAVATGYRSGAVESVQLEPLQVVVVLRR